MLARKFDLVAISTAVLFFTVSGTASAGKLTYDFNLPDGTNAGFANGAVLATNPAANAQVVGNRLRLTQSTTGNNAAFHIPAQPDSTIGFSVWFDYELSEPAGGNPPADGFSFSYGNIPFGGLSSQAEEGWPGNTPVMSWEMDTWMNGDAEVGPAIAVNNANIPGGFINGDILNNGGTISGQIHIDLFSDGTTNFSSTGAITDANFAGLVSGFALDNNHSFALAARTGGAFEALFIDNLVVQWHTVVPEPSTLVIGFAAMLSFGAVNWRRRRRRC